MSLVTIVLLKSLIWLKNFCLFQLTFYEHFVVPSTQEEKGHSFPSGDKCSDTSGSTFIDEIEAFL